jgi:hypothetical protein
VTLLLLLAAIPRYGMLLALENYTALHFLHTSHGPWNEVAIQSITMVISDFIQHSTMGPALGISHHINLIWAFEMARIAKHHFTNGRHRSQEHTCYEQCALDENQSIVKVVNR